MGLGASRAAGRAVTKASPAPPAKPPATDALASLPVNSAVRRDAVDGAVLREQRLAAEAGGLPLEELNSKDENLIALMQQTMVTSEGNIRFREHVLPLNDDALATDLVSKVKTEQQQTETIFAAREAAEAAGAGRIPMEAFKAAISTLQAQERSAEAVAAVAAKHGCSAARLTAVLRYASVPAIHTGLVNGKHALRAVWH
eukprot:jgi/Ulvmu1/1999/UM012_0162.1